MSTQSNINGTEDETNVCGDFADDNEDEEEGLDADVCSSSFHPICAPRETCSTLEAAVNHDLQHGSFDLLSIFLFLSSFNDDEDDMYYDAIKCINFCRKYVASSGNSKSNSDLGVALDAKCRNFISSSQQGENDEEAVQYFKPVLENDAYLMNLEDLLGLMNLRRKVNGEEQNSIGAKQGSNNNSKVSELKMMQARISSLEEQLSKTKLCISTLTREDDSTNNTEKKKPIDRDNDTYYFASYSHYGIHQTMLQDAVRTGSYESAIMDNASELFKGKTVLDVGCGTGILSMFAAKAGAKKVVAVDNSADILASARQIANVNGYGNVITFVHGKIEDLVKSVDENDSATPSRIPLEKGEVDVIVSEWMGYALFFETMLPSVMVARDQLMKKNDDSATMFPNATQVFLEGATDNSLDYWSDVNGFDLSPMKDKIVFELTSEAGVEVVPSDAIVTDRCELISYDLNTCLDSDLDFDVPFQLLPNEKENGAKIDKLVISFDIDFNPSKCKSPVSFSTGCQTTPTHWKQSVLWLDPIVAPNLFTGEVMTGTFKMGRNEINHRDMNFHVLWEVRGIDGNVRCDGSIKSKLTA